jgi:hypothetical protein
MFELDLTPPPGIARSTGEAPAPGIATAVLLLFNRQWLNLQTYVTQALQLPRSAGEFSWFYGEFDIADRDRMAKAANAMAELYYQASVFGNPAMMRQRLAQESGYLTDSEPPAALYGHIVWAVNQQSAIAALFARACDSLRIELASNASAETRLLALREILAGDGGLASDADGVVARMKLLLHQVDRFNRVLGVANATMTADAGPGLISIVGQRVAELQGLADAAAKASAKAYSNWVDFSVQATNSAITANFVKVGISIIGAAVPMPEFGKVAVLSVEVAKMVVGKVLVAGANAGAGLLDRSEELRLSAAEQRTAHGRLIEAMYRAEADKLKKVRLYTDLDGIASSTKLGTEGLTKVAADLRAMLNAWESLAARLRTIARDATAQDLQSVDAAKLVAGLNASRTKWQEIVSAADFFIQNSLVEFNASLPWGKLTAS